MCFYVTETLYKIAKVTNTSHLRTLISFKMFILNITLHLWCKILHILNLLKTFYSSFESPFRV
jgi:hypothetical protein